MMNKNKRARHAPLISDQNDRISELPDDILVLILSRLNIKEAARTSVLSHIWRNLWKLFSGCLDFEAKDTMWLLYRGERNRFNEAKKFGEWVYKVIRALEVDPTVEQLRIVFPFDSRYAYHITTWLYFAIVRGVQKLELDLTRLYGCCVGSRCNDYTFRSWLLHIPPNSPNFNRLTSLRLKSVSISDDDLAYFLSTCPLEQLLVQNASDLQNVRVSGPSIKLKHLEINCCLKLETVEVSATSLESLAYAGQKISMSFGKLPQLSSVSLSMDCCEMFVLDFHSHLCFSLLQKLELDMRWIKRDRYWDFPTKFPEFSNLKQLELKFTAVEDQSLLFLSSIIGASRCLQELKLKYKMHPFEKAYPPPPPFFTSIEKVWEEHARTYTHQCLKIIEFVGWVGRKVDVELANYFLQTAVSLDKIILDLRTPNFFRISWMGEFDLFNRDEGEREAERKAALLSAMQLEKKLPPGVQLITHQ